MRVNMLTLVCIALYVLICICRTSCFTQNVTSFNTNIEHFIELQKEAAISGFKLNLHKTLTEDGYVLKIFRIEVPNAVKREPVVLMHGFFGCGDAWFLQGNQSLPFLLSNEGYDVWITNTRGTIHSIDHLWLNNTSKEYWRYSFQEIGQYDFPASFNYILSNNIHSKLIIIAHSSGTTQLYALLATQPQYNDLIKISIHYTPSGSFRYFNLPWQVNMCKAVDFLMQLTSEIGWHSIWPWGYASMRGVLKDICSIYKELCKNAFISVAMDEEQIKDLEVSQVLKRIPCGGSLNELFHYMQTVKRGGALGYFDWGLEENLKRYNSTSVPLYDFSKITSPVGLFYGSHDEYVTPQDVIYLSKLLPNVVILKPIVCDEWGHLDFIIGKDAYKAVYADTIKLIKKYINPK